MKQLNTPHDRLFRAVLQRPGNAASELQTALPAWVIAEVDWDQLELCPGVFLSDRLQQRETDLLFRTRFRDSGELVYLLLEHQSRPDRWMPIRISEYVLAIWNKHRKEYPGVPLPMVIPVVVHSGHAHRKWDTATELAELLAPEGQRLFGPWLSSQWFVLDDVALLEVDDLLQRGLEPAVVLVFILHKIAPGNPRVLEDLARLDHLLSELLGTTNGSDDLRTAATYIYGVADIGLAAVQRVLGKFDPRVTEVLMTTAERLRAEGRIEGRLDGLRQGILLVLEVKFGPLSEVQSEVVRAATAEELDSWAHNVFAAERVEDVFVS
ncbi:Rpn family recombination-promoting nuclease/putative transposase [Nocardia sp. BMG111209]|uniref:Rpn family recombination-promoting nuclease/putative transposase n=1 Tax=Nocardia sp. BMG111209 TaxID=1160137 RepID=UPI000381436F|nr:Rpn family recombination-promoting nuclease/putative transposase [Nocardia sp. BMG111209]